MTRRLLLVLAAVAALACAPAALGAAANGPDLVAGSVKGKPKHVVAGARFTVKVTIKNRGNRKAGKSTLALFLSPRSRHKSGDLSIGRAKVRALKPHKSQTVKVKAKLPAVKASARALKPGSYRVIACVDATHKVKERNEKNDCRVEKGAPLKLVAPTSNTPPPPPVAPPTPAPEPAFAMADNYDWGFAEDATRHDISLGDPIDVTLRAANGFAGQAGYTRSLVAHQDTPGGTTTDVPVDENDDGVATVSIPFTFAFAGIPYNSVSVSTNGWVGFDPPAWDYGNDEQANDFRGQDGVVGQFYRGLMPYWTDLDVGSSPTGSIKETVAPGNASVTFAWDVGECCAPPSTPVHKFSVTLFPDGSFRYDYGPGSEAGARDRFVGYSAGNGSLDDFSNTGTNEPTSSLLYTPKPLPPAVTLPAGAMTMTIPRGTIAGTLDPGCTVTRPATALADGQLSCSVPSLTGGQSIVRHVGWVESADEITTDPPTREYSGAYTPGGTAAITDDDELVGTALFSPNVATTTGVTYTGSEPPQTGSPTTFAVLPDQGHAGLVNASLTIALPDNTTLDSIKVEGQTDDYASCQPPSGGSVTCLLPSVRDYLVLDVTVTPTAAAEGSPLTLSASTHGDNAGVVTPGQASSSGNVTP